MSGDLEPGYYWVEFPHARGTWGLAHYFTIPGRRARWFALDGEPCWTPVTVGPRAEPPTMSPEVYAATDRQFLDAPPAGREEV